MDVYILADKYLVKGLKRNCEFVIQICVNPRKLIEWSILSYRLYSTGGLFDLVLEALSQNVSKIFENEPELLEMFDDEGAVLRHLLVKLYKRKELETKPDVTDDTSSVVDLSAGEWF